MKKTALYNTRFQFPAVFLSVMFLLVSFWISGYSQMTVTNGTTLKITSGSTLNSTDNTVLSPGGTLDVQGTLILKKNLVNQNASANSLGSGTIVFSGTANQTISGQNIIQNLELANANGLTVSGNTRVNGVLTLTNGLVTLGAYNLLLGPSASVSGTPAATKMVVPEGAGQLQKEFSAAGSFTYPVGDATGTAEYSPVTLAFNSGTFAANNYAGVNLVDAQYAGTATSFLSRYWNVSQTNISSFSCNATFKYIDPADVNGTESDIFSFRVNPAPFTAYAASNTGTNEISVHGLSSFGTFTGNLGNGSTPPDVRSMQDRTIADARCADALQTLVIAGNGTSFVVQSGGHMEEIAGQNILYYPGTKVDLNGYMWGHISNVFCQPPNPIGAPIFTTNTEGSQVKPENSANSFFRIYPNPTPGKFTLELKGDATSSQVHVEIYGILGDKILAKDMVIDRKQEFSLTDKPTGVYVIHVSSGVNSETEKIIKR
jgi:hypothetical protein